MTSTDQPRLATLCFLLFATASGGQIAAQLISPGGHVFHTQAATASALGNSPADWEVIWQADRQTELESRITHLESTIADSMEFQNRLLELVEDLTRQQSDTPADRSVKQTTSSPAAAELLSPTHQRNPTGRSYHNLTLNNLLNAGFSAAQVEFILKHEKRLSRPITASKNGGFADPLRALYDFFKSELSSDELNRYLEATHKRKVILIVGIYPGSTAANIGLQPGDRILSVNGEPIFSAQYTTSQINTVSPGVVIPIEIRRPGSTISETLYIPGGKLGIEAQLQPWQ